MGNRIPTNIAEGSNAWGREKSLNAWAIVQALELCCNAGSRYNLKAVAMEKEFSYTAPLPM